MLTDAGTYRIERHPILGPLPDAERAEITVDGVALAALEGDSIASAMLANGIRAMRTMPESGSPRGYFCGVGRCSDCIVTVDGELNVVGCTTSVRGGMRIETQRGLGSWTES
jgi:predicted molibdopterin-dependent oxidoreductase YjgC